MKFEVYKLYNHSNKQTISFGCDIFSENNANDSNGKSRTFQSIYKK